MNSLSLSELASYYGHEHAYEMQRYYQEENESEQEEKAYPFFEEPESEQEPENNSLTEYQFLLKHRFQSAVERYVGLEEFMEIPDMDLWLDLKKEIQENPITNHYIQRYCVIYPENIEDPYDYDYDDYSLDSIDRAEIGAEKCKDYFTCSRGYDRD